MSTMYELYPKSNETGVIKTLLKNIKIYQSQIPSKNHVFHKILFTFLNFYFLLFKQVSRKTTECCRRCLEGHYPLLVRHKQLPLY